MDVVPSDAEKIVIKENSFNQAETLSISNYSNLTSLVFEENVFHNAKSIEISGAQLEELVIGDNCFSDSESGVRANRRLEDVERLIFYTPNVKHMVIGTKSLLNVNTLVFYELLDSVEFELGKESMINVNLIQYNYGISVDTVNNIKSLIENNKGQPGSIVIETINTGTTSLNTLVSICPICGLPLAVGGPS